VTLRNRSPLTEPNWVKWLLIAIAVAFLLLFIILPTSIVFVAALSKGLHAYLQVFTDSYAIFAIKLTILVALASLSLNVIFGIAASWAITKFQFKGKEFLITVIELPFSVSPVIAGLIYVMLFGSQSLLGHWLIAHDIRIIFAVPGLIIATTFVTLPFIARELLPVMEKQGTEAEEVAILLGAGFWQTFWRVTLPKIKWGLLYGILLCNARAMGEFGAVSIVSGHIRGATTTMPLYVQMLYNEYSYIGAFALASTLTLLALLTLVLKIFFEAKNQEL
jgi:sulfate/thiosulfate transport system permease protein